jgi:uncharacterized NAD(P)/FAD-binding protein YdhS
MLGMKPARRSAVGLPRVASRDGRIKPLKVAGRGNRHRDRAPGTDGPENAAHGLQHLLRPVRRGLRRSGDPAAGATRRFRMLTQVPAADLRFGPMRHHREPEAALPHVVVIGGGLSGTAFAIHLLRDHPALRVRLTVIEPRATLGAGLAYGTRDPQHRINVAASRMSLFAEDAGHFERWLRGQNGEAAADPDAVLPDGRLFPRRGRFGAYLAATLDGHLGEAADRVRFRHLRDVATAVRSVGTRHEIRTEGGERLEADLLVLAVGHPAPATPSYLAGLPPGALVADPWAHEVLAAVPPDARVLVVGTGLTASDVIASLSARRHRGPIIALSRHGLLPRPRTQQAVEAFGDFAAAPATTALALLRRVRHAVSERLAQGRPWEDVIDALRRDAGAVWGALSVTERGRLLRHLRSFWDVHRFQSAPQIDAVIEALRRTGQLSVEAGRIRRVTPWPTGLRVDWRPRHARGKRRDEPLEVDVIVNCTGPGHRSIVDTNPALASLAAAGLVQPDPHGLGLAVDRTNHPVSVAGEPVRTIFVAGPPARSAHGELMGLPQVSAQPRRIAEAVAQRLAAAQFLPDPSRLENAR